MARDMDRTALGLLALGHLLNDINQGAVPALLPFLVTEQGLSYVAASGIVVAVTLISGITQPLLGLYSDRHPITWLIPVGMLLGGLGIAAVGFTADYWLIIGFMLVSGLGVAAFHPESYRFANYVSGNQRASGLSIFAVGGNLGFAVGPILLTAAVVAFGLNGTIVLLIPAALYALVLAFNLKRISQYRPTKVEIEHSSRTNPTNWRAFLQVVAIIVIRTVVQYGVLTFVPLYLHNVRMLPIAEANTALVFISVSGAVGTIVGGVLAGRFGYRRMLVLCLATIPPFLLVFLYSSGVPAYAALAIAGMAIAGSFSVALVIGQAYAESNLGVASGITAGLAIGLGGLSSPVLGRVADVFGLSPVIWILALVPIAAIVLALLLPPMPPVTVHPEINSDSADIAP